MPAPSGEQYEIAGHGYVAVVTESGAALRELTYDGRALVDGFGAGEMSHGCRGQLLVPWPNRIRDGRYSWHGQDHQLPLTEPSRRNASHGLVRWVAWTLDDHTETAAVLRYRLMAQTGYPWTLDLVIRYELTQEGLVVTQSGVNRADSPAPYAHGAHPYLSVGPGPIDGWELTLPAAKRSVSDPERLLPTGRESVEGTEFDFRAGRRIGDTEMNHAFTGLQRDAAGVATVVVREPTSGAGVELWVDAKHPWLMVYTADDSPDTARRSIAVEPMTVQADAFRTGEDVVTLEPGAEFSAAWGIRAL